MVGSDDTTVPPPGDESDELAGFDETAEQPAEPLSEDDLREPLATRGDDSDLAPLAADSHDGMPLDTNASDFAFTDPSERLVIVSSSSERMAPSESERVDPYAPEDSDDIDPLIASDAAHVAVGSSGGSSESEAIDALSETSDVIDPYGGPSASNSEIEFGFEDEIDRSGTPMIHMENVFKSFGERQILRGIDLAVYPRETICIIGGSGSGKSVSLKHIMRLIDPDKGKIWLDGEDITEAHGDRLQRARTKLGVNFQFGALLNWLTVFENVALPLRETTDMKEPEIERRVMAKLELLKIPHAAHLFPTQISGGMVKRAGLARAVVMEESLKVILYDEPTSGLDPISTALVDEMINEMKARLGLTQVVVTHDMASAYRIANRIAVLYEGKIVQYGTPEEIQNSKVPYVQQFVQGLSTQEALKESQSKRLSKSALRKALKEEDLE